MAGVDLTTNELINLSLAESDDEIRWQYIQILHQRGNKEVFEAARKLCESGDAKKITLGADILGQLGAIDLPFKNESLPLLLNLADSNLRNSQDEADIEALQAVIIALGRMETPEALKKISEFKAHLDAWVREAVAFGFSTTSEEDFVINTLIELSGDSDEDVRNWATFGLGQTEADTKAIREALFQRLNEDDTETGNEIRGEALVGLARRKDERVVEPLLRELLGDCVGKLAVEAASEIADKRFCDALLKLKSWWDVDEELLNEAIKNCCRD